MSKKRKASEVAESMGGADEDVELCEVQDHQPRDPSQRRYKVEMEDCHLSGLVVVVNRTPIKDGRTQAWADGLDREKAWDAYKEAGGARVRPHGPQPVITELLE